MTREDAARRFRVSLGMVKKLIQQRRHTGSIAHRHRQAGRKPRIVPEHQRQRRALLGQKPDLTGATLAQVTPQDAIGWFTSCG